MPHALNSSQKAVQVQVSRELRDFLESGTDGSMSNVYTGDETWGYLYNPRTSMWTGTEITRPIRVRRTVTSKWFLGTDFARTRIGAVVMLPAGQSFNKEFFAGTVLPRIVDDRALSRPQLETSGSFHDRDKAHLTSGKYDKFEIKRLRHPPYSPDLTPCDFWLLKSVNHCFAARFLDDIIALERVLPEILMSIGHGMFVSVFAEWKHRLQQYINQRGDYL
jgi:histone-lysine N-methyltransferase SETMAR